MPVKKTDPKSGSCEPAFSLSSKMEFVIDRFVCNRNEKNFFSLSVTPVGPQLLRRSTAVTCNRIVIVLLFKSPEELYLFQLTFSEMRTCPLLLPRMCLLIVYNLAIEEQTRCFTKNVPYFKAKYLLTNNFDVKFYYFVRFSTTVNFTYESFSEKT